MSKYGELERYARDILCGLEKPVMPDGYTYWNVLEFQSGGEDKVVSWITCKRLTKPRGRFALGIGWDRDELDGKNCYAAVRNTVKHAVLRFSRYAKAYEEGGALPVLADVVPTEEVAEVLPDPPLTVGEAAQVMLNKVAEAMRGGFMTCVSSPAGTGYYVKVQFVNLEQAQALHEALARLTEGRSKTHGE